jgi:predicted transcriptional regulator of viral defense system
VPGIIAGVVENSGYPRKNDHEPGIDRLIARLAARQHGYVTRRQLFDHGVPRHAIDHRIQAGRLIRVHAGVYAVGHVNLSPIARAGAAVLACGPGALLSHSSAAALWGMGRWGTRAVEVTAPGKHRRVGIEVHRSATLTRADWTTHYGIRVTSPARTIFDIARRLTDKQLTRAVNEALHSNYLRRGVLDELMQRHERHRTTERLRAILDGGAPTRSDLEDDFKAFARRFGLPRPTTNTRVGGREVDALFEAEGVIVELDSWRFHRTRAAFERDRDRDAEMLRRGLATVRVTYERLQQDPEREAERLEAILAAAAVARRNQLLGSSQTALPASPPTGGREPAGARPNSEDEEATSP